MRHLSLFFCSVPIPSSFQLQGGLLLVPLGEMVFLQTVAWLCPPWHLSLSLHVPCSKRFPLTTHYKWSFLQHSLLHGHVLFSSLYLMTEQELFISLLSSLMGTGTLFTPILLAPKNSVCHSRNSSKYLLNDQMKAYFSLSYL